MAGKKKTESASRKPTDSVPTKARGTPKPPHKKAAEPVILAELARLLGITPPRVSQLVSDGMPRHSDGTFPIPDAITWYVQRKIDSAVRGKASETDDIKTVRLEIAREELMALQRVRAKEEGQTILVSDVAVLLSGPLRTLAGMMRSAPTRYANKIVNKSSIPAAIIALQDVFLSVGEAMVAAAPEVVRSGLAGALSGEDSE